MSNIISGSKIHVTFALLDQMAKVTHGRGQMETDEQLRARLKEKAKCRLAV